MQIDWITPEQAASSWGVKTRQVQALCIAGHVYGAVKLGRVWLIPKGTPKPVDGRTKFARLHRNNSAHKATAAIQQKKR